MGGYKNMIAELKYVYKYRVIPIVKSAYITIALKNFIYHLKLN